MKKTVCILLLLVMLLCTSCGEDVMENDPNEFMVVTSFYPTYVVTANLMEGTENTKLVNLTDAEAGCIHGYMLTSEDMNMLNAADLFIASGMGMEAFIEKSSFGIPQLELLDCGEDISHELGDEERFNPHYWMNIKNAVDQCEKVKKSLCRLDPKNTETYERNAAEYKAKLETLIPEITERIGKLQNKDMVVFHESFDYFADQFGLNVVSLLSDPNGNALSSEEITQVINYMKANNIKAVFTEKGKTSNDTLDRLKKETGCSVYVLDTLASGKIDGNVKDAYFNAMRANLNTLEKALG